MNEENNQVINFTTQNSFLHYGVKGMKWGVINSEYEPIGKIKARYEQNKHGREVTRDRQLTSFVKSYLKGSPQPAYPRPKTIKSTTIHDGPVRRQPNVTGKGTAPSLNSEDKKRKQEKIKSKEDLQKAIANSNKQNKEKDSKDVKTINKFDNAFTEFDNTKDYDEKTMSQYIGTAMYWNNSLDKYAKAFDSISDMDKKYSEKLWDKYKDKITNYIHEYAEAMDKGFSMINENWEEIGRKTHGNFGNTYEAKELSDRFFHYKQKIDSGTFDYTDYKNFEKDRRSSLNLIDALSSEGIDRTYGLTEDENTDKNPYADDANTQAYDYKTGRGSTYYEKETSSENNKKKKK